MTGRSRLPQTLRALVEAQTSGREEQAKNKPQEGRTGPRAPKAVLESTRRQRPAHWPAGVDSELEMMLYVRLERAGLPLGVGQYRFVPGRLYRFDRAYPSQMVAVEIQGGVWVNGAHSRGSGVQRDCLKLSLGAALGWRVLPVTREMIESGLAVELIRQALGGVR